MKGFISRPALQAITVLFALFIFAKPSAATTAVLLTDEQLVTSSRVIIIGEVLSLKSQWDAGHQNIYTYVKVHVSRTLKGELKSDEIVFKQLGGAVGDDITVIFGAPDYVVGQRVLLFLDTARDGTLRVAHLFQGKYDVTADQATGKTLVERKISDSVNLLGAQEGPGITNSATLGNFRQKIKSTLREQAADVAFYALAHEGVPIVEIPAEYIDDARAGDIAPQYTFLGSGYRWFQPDSGQAVSYRLNQTGAPVAGGGVTEINQELAAWTNVQTTALVLQNIGSTSAFGFQADGVSAISYNDPLDQMQDPVGCSGTLAIGGVSNANGETRIIGGQVFNRILEGDVVFNRNFGCFLGVSINLAEVACHEIGHSIGFGHSADSAAIMAPTARGNRGAVLAADDIAAVSFLYPGSKGGGGGCSFTVSPTSQGFTSAGGLGSVGVTTQSGCAWTAATNSSWIVLTSAATASGNGMVTFEVRENFTTTSRTGSLTVAGTTVTINQNGANQSTCSYSISPASATHAASAASGSVMLTTTTGCSWSAASNESWATITSSSSGIGSAVVTYTVSANTTGRARKGTMTIAGKTFSIKQRG